MNASGNNTECYEIEGLGEAELVMIRQKMVITLFGLCIVSTALHCYVVTKACRLIRKYSSDRCMHIFIINMTIADALLTGIAYPMEYVRNFHEFPPMYYLNLTMHFLLWLGTSVSGLSLVLMNLDKLVFFKFPLNYSKRITRGRAQFLAVSVWLASGLFIYLTIVTALECYDECETLSFPKTIGGYNRWMYIFFMFCVSVFPAVSSLAVALYLLRVVRSHRKQIAEEQSLFPNSAGVRKSHMLLSRMRTFYFIFISTICTFVTLIPYRVIVLYSLIVQPSAATASCLTLLIKIIGYYNIELNSILNPLITVTVLPQYRFRFFEALVPAKFKRPSEDSIKCSTDM